MEKAGLSPNEAKCYIALLKIGSASANELSRTSGIHRVSIYDALRGLAEKGLVSQIKEENKQYFQAADPERIREYLIEKVNTIENLLPELNKIRKSEEETTVEVYKGKEGIKSIINDYIRVG